MATDKELDEYDENFYMVRAEVLSNSIARAAAMENALRRQIAKDLRQALRCANIADESYIELSERVVKYFPKHHSRWQELAFAETTRVSSRQLRRLFHEEVGGDLMLSSICRVLDFLGLEMKIEIKRKETDGE